MGILGPARTPRNTLVAGYIYSVIYTPAGAGHKQWPAWRGVLTFGSAFGSPGRPEPDANPPLQHSCCLLSGDGRDHRSVYDGSLLGWQARERGERRSSLSVIA